MRESDDEFAALEGLLNASIEKAGPFIRESLEMPRKSLSARQLLRYWNGLLTAAVAHTTAGGEPRVAPTGVMLVHGHLVVPTVANAARTKAVTARPALSISRFDENDLAVIAHGEATIVRAGDARFEELAALQREFGNGRDVRDWGGGGGVYLWMAPHTLYTFARFRETFPE